MTAGPSVIRTRKASMPTPMARPKAMGLMVPDPSGMKKANTEIMMTAAATTTFAECRKPISVGLVWFPWTYSSRIREVRKTS